MSVIIPAWNDEDTLPDCLASVLSSTYQDKEVIVIDNGSTDGTFALLKDKFPNVTIIRNVKNIGFGGAVNQGILVAEGEYILILSSDATLDSEWISTLLCAFGENARLGMGTSMVVYKQPKNIVWSAGGLVDGVTGLTWDHGKGENVSSVAHLPHPDYLSACASMLRRDALEAVGLLDSGYFAYFEDADLSLRLKAAGYEIALIDSVPVLHSAARKSGIRGNMRDKFHLFVRSNFRFILKNWSRPRVPLALMVCLAFYLSFAIAKGPAKYVPPIIAALVWNIRQVRNSRPETTHTGRVAVPPPRLRGLLLFIIRMTRRPELYPY